MEDPAKVMLGVSFAISIAYSVKAIANAIVQYQINARTPRAVGTEAERLARIEHALDAIALEVERISEGQRFTTKLLSDRSQTHDHLRT
jgi:hypothetical protein